MKYPIAYILLIVLLAACDSSPDVQQIVSLSIQAHGGKQLDQSALSFDFRKKHYEISLDNGKFTYESFANDSIGRVHDVLTNTGFTRSIDGQKTKLSEEDKIKYKNALNSVVYFALLPYYLNDPAANKELLGITEIKGKTYYEVRVTFDQQGGGTDFEDEFIYWIHQDDYTMDYLAYSFHVNDGGTRFRQAYNVRQVDGIRLADYVNYESTVEDFTLHNYDSLFIAGKVKELSRIELENVTIE